MTSVEKATLDVTMVICAVMLVVAWMHVIRRYAFNSALTWSEEFLRFTIVWYAMLSASILHKRNGHLGITIFREMMPKKLQKFLQRIVIYLATLTVGIVTVAGAILVSCDMGADYARARHLHCPALCGYSFQLLPHDDLRHHAHHPGHQGTAAPGRGTSGTQGIGCLRVFHP